ncbi:MAG TPA: hypothetical protein VGF55_04315 [Gemmataceae bacterium]|jgi:hypothetical protein
MTMTNRVVSFLALWGLNVLAAYAPAVLYVPGLAGSAGAGWKFLFSPVLLAGLWLWVTDPAVAWCLLIAFVGALGLASAVLCRVRRAWTVVPGIVGVYSLVQGLFAAAVINGIDGVGHS